MHLTTSVSEFSKKIEVFVTRGPFKGIRAVKEGEDKGHLSKVSEL